MFSNKCVINGSYYCYCSFIWSPFSLSLFPLRLSNKESRRFFFFKLHNSNVTIVRHNNNNNNTANNWMLFNASSFSLDFFRLDLTCGWRRLLSQNIRVKTQTVPLAAARRLCVNKSVASPHQSAYLRGEMKADLECFATRLCASFALL